MDQRLETEPEIPASIGAPKGEVRVTLSSDQMIPPVGSEVTLARTDGTRVPMVLMSIDVQPNGDQVLHFLPHITP